MGNDIALDSLPAWEREIMGCCLRLTPSDLEHHRHVWECLLVGEKWLALGLVVAGCPKGLPPDEYVRLLALIEAMSYEMWAAPGAAAVWLSAHLR